MPVSRPADERFGGMSSLDAIIERLREQACGPDEYRHWNYVEAVTVEQAEAAVLAAGDARTAEIVEALRERDATQPDNVCATCGLPNPGPEHRANAPALCNADRTRDYARKRIGMLGTPADFVARRFPSSGDTTRVPREAGGF